MQKIYTYLDAHPVLKDHLRSAITTFGAVFLVTLMTSVQGGFGPNFGTDMVISIFIAGVRAGFKAMVELIVTWLPEKK